MIENKLNKSQRETAGAATFLKYDYQYHWALYKAISLTKESAEYVVFVEMHEDVVIGDSLDGNAVKFDFNQVKTEKNKYTAKKLVERPKNNKGEEKLSILAKLLSNQSRFEHSQDVIKQYSIVASNGFNLKLKDGPMNYETIDFADLVDLDAEILSNAIKKELEIESLPSNLRFITSSYLPEKGFRDFMIGFIATVMEDVFETSHGARGVYRALIDELHKKGQKVLDFKHWEDLVETKGVTSVTVENVIKQFTDKFILSEFQQSLNYYIQEMNINATMKISIRRYAMEYLSERNNPSSSTARQSAFISEKVRVLLGENLHIDINSLINQIWNSMEENDKSLFQSKQSPKLIAWIITENIYFINNESHRI